MKPLMQKSQVIGIISLLTGMGLSACSTTPEPNMALETARSQYYAAEADAQLSEHAPLALAQAKEKLTEAERLHEDGADREEVEHQAYLAAQKVAIAREKAKLEQAEQVIETAAVERTETLLEARTRELELLKQELAGRETERGLILTLGDIFFDTGQAQLKPGAMLSIQRLATYLQANPERRIAVEGFTDSRGSEDYNLNLSGARAEAVRTALINVGIEPHRIQTTAYGEAFPVADNSTAPGQQLNRRVEIVISDEQGMIPPRPARA